MTHSIRRDAIFVLFGAPVWKEDDAERAAACAIAMQLAMDSINEQNRLEDLPEIEMGIGVHTGQVVVGDIGSPQRMKYDVIGSQVNLTSRIQSCMTGGQILISHAARVGPHSQTRAPNGGKGKGGVEQPVTLFEVLGFGGRHKPLLLPDASEELIPLKSSIPIRYEIVEATLLGHEAYKGMLTKLSRKAAEAILDHPVSNLTNVKMHLMQDGREIPCSLYAKVIDAVAGSGNAFSLRFTSVPPEIERFFQTRLQLPPIPRPLLRLSSRAAGANTSIIWQRKSRASTTIGGTDKSDALSHTYARDQLCRTAASPRLSKNRRGKSYASGQRNAAIFPSRGDADKRSYGQTRRIDFLSQRGFLCAMKYGGSRSTPLHYGSYCGSALTRRSCPGFCWHAWTHLFIHAA